MQQVAVPSRKWLFSFLFIALVDAGSEGLTMRKEQDGDVPKSSKASITIASQGHMTIAERDAVDHELALEKAGLRPAPVQQHKPSVLVKKQKVKACSADCTWNVQISSSKKSNFKTVQIKGCKEEDFHFDGCSATGDAAMMCINGEHTPAGVRVLKNSRDEIVGYGSCCVGGEMDKVVATSAAFCGERHSAKPAPVEMVAEAKSIDLNVAEVAQHSPATSKLSWSAWPQKATSILQALTALARRYKFQAFLLASACIALAAIGSATSLMYAHLKVSMQLTGGLSPAHSSTSTYIGLLWCLPVLCILGVIGLVLSELTPVWQFLQAILLANALRIMPDMLMHVGGGRLQLQRGLQIGELEKLHVFTQWPFSFLRCFVAARAPAMADVSDLQWGVAVMCSMLPILSFVEMFCTLEASFVTAPGSVMHPYFSSAAPSVATFVRIMEVLFIAVGMAALNGLDLLVRTLSPRAAQEMNSGLKLTYCTCFLGGLRLFPVLLHLCQTSWGEGVLRDSPDADAARSAVMCVSSLICALVAWKAFPVDEHHYPELAAARSSATSNKESLKPVLDQVKFCPFCGSCDLELEATTPSGECAACPRCCARQMPLHLIVHRGTTLAKETADIPKEVATGGLQNELTEG